jgi:GDP-4-dehydro-6-deoxy-D-mannose reductase
LITGATGFAGSFLVEHYAARGWRVHGTHREPAEWNVAAPPDVAIHSIDLRVEKEVRDLVQAVQPDVIHHLAAQSSVSLSFDEPMATLTDNAAAQFYLLEAAAAIVPRARVLVVGSCDEYGNVLPEENPITEEHELRPASPYGLSKVVQDLMGRQYVEMRDLCVIRVRPFLQIGPRRSSRFVAGSFARQIAQIERGLTEPVIQVGTIDLQRDFTDVRDVVRAYALAAEEGAPGEVYNIASNTTHTLRDLLRIMLDHAAVAADIRPAPNLERPGEAPLLQGDFSRLHARTGWEPRIGFEQAASDTLDYWRERVMQDYALARPRA